MTIIPIILSGGAGTRLWPLSWGDHPKQFLSLITDKTMIQETLLRLDGLETGYGLGDNYELQGSHVFPAMIRKFHEAKASGEDVVHLWGDGSPLREFLYAGDLADAVVYLMETKDASDLRTPTGDFVNVGTGKECTIKELAETIEDVVYADVRKDGRKCKMDWDSSKPNGTPRKLCDVTRLNALGWKAKVDVREGVEIAYNDFLHGEVRK